MPAVALRIRLLLLSSRRGDRARARALAEHSRGLGDVLDAWLDCLDAERVFEPGFRSGTELDARCPFPADERPLDRTEIDNP